MTTLARLVLMTAAGTLLAYGGLAQAQGPVVQVQAVAGGSALLPCDITPPLANDSVLLVIWYKNEMTPIYSYDTRGAQPERGSHWKEKGILAERGYFRTMSEPATFNLESIDERDEGDYRCRVDFKKSPTRNTKVRLTVVVPPQKPNIVDERGKEVQNVAGPYEEGAELKLTCIVSGGKPTPTLRWWRDDHLVDSIDVQSSFPNVKQNQLYVRRLERADLHATYTCKASNNNISQPVFAKVSLEMHCEYILPGPPLRCSLPRRLWYGRPRLLPYSRPVVRPTRTVGGILKSPRNQLISSAFPQSPRICVTLLHNLCATSKQESALLALFSGLLARGENMGLR
ncbi:Hypothetical predicted protein [Cloeon dipterum]|uniref:Ig-like domain-containing protein n=1 Tax=Cloeon dipterum TaxID=197152 RepID=A0A8S1CFB8_9INSE|nr:Hypothetical predicted protein [Cloeon dipterum]